MTFTTPSSGPHGRPSITGTIVPGHLSVRTVSLLSIYVVGTLTSPGPVDLTPCPSITPVPQRVGSTDTGSIKSLIHISSSVTRLLGAIITRSVLV